MVVLIDAAERVAGSASKPLPEPVAWPIAKKQANTAPRANTMISARGPVGARRPPVRTHRVSMPAVLTTDTQSVDRRAEGMNRHARAARRGES